MRLDREAFHRGLWPEALVAALATLAVAWPLTDLLREQTWMMPAALLVGLVALVGAVLRTLDVAPSLVSVAQLLAGIGGVVQVYLHQTLWHGILPTQQTVDLGGAFLRQAGSVLRTYAAPAPTTTGVAFLVVAVITLTAVSVDAMGVTGRAPASAGIPLAAAFLVSVSNNGEAMKPWYFLAVAICWLIMLAQQGHRLTMAWPSAAHRPEQRGDAGEVTSGRRSSRGLAQALGGLALAGAVLGAAALPHLPPTFFSEGLARSDQARSASSSGKVDFTETMDPSRDLRSQSKEPVLTYRTNAIVVEPLRVTASTTFRDGRWVAPRRTDATLRSPAGDLLPRPAGLSAAVRTTTQQVEVTANGLQPPHLASPGYPAQVEAPVPWRFDTSDGTVLLRGTADSYQVRYLTLARDTQLPRSVGRRAADPADFAPELLEVDPVSAAEVGDLADRVVGRATSSFDKAVRIQEHLRSNRYRYSLTLAPSAQADARDPIGGFLATRQGYCVQFATAMVMMARHEGIPARMAVGFLPGDPAGQGLRSVLRSDAHTWPELWIDGLGWTRFEPTPGIHAGNPPAYTMTQEKTDQSATTRTETVQADPTPTREPTAEATPPPAPQKTFADDLAVLLRAAGQALGLVVLLGLLMALVPWAGRRYRTAELRRATTARDRVEGEWVRLTRTLGDLGVSSPPARSPQDMEQHYRAGTRLGDAGEAALGRVTGTLERSRYAPPSTLVEDDADRMGEDVATVVEAVRRRRSWEDRARATLLPRSGFEALRTWFGRR